MPAGLLGVVLLGAVAFVGVKRRRRVQPTGGGAGTRTADVSMVVESPLTSVDMGAWQLNDAARAAAALGPSQPAKLVVAPPEEGAVAAQERL